MSSRKPAGQVPRTLPSLGEAAKRHLVTSPRTKQITVKVSPALFEAAAECVGSQSPSEVVSAALAALVQKDDLGAWLVRNAGKWADLPPEILELIEF